MASTDTAESHDTALSKDKAPAPESAAKPDTPPDIDKPTWKYVAGRAGREFSRDECTDLAAALTYYAVLSLFPGLLALVSLLGIVGQAQATTDFMIDTIESFSSGGVSDTIRQPIEQLATSGGAGLAFFVGIAGALWSASGYVGAFGRAMNRIYEVDEGRPVWKLRPQMLLVTLAIVLLAVLGVAILVLSGPVAEAVGNAIGLGPTTVAVWDIAKWPVLVVIAVATIAVLYYFTPNVRQPKFRWISLGAFGALLVLAIATVGFFFYVSNFGNYNKTYGSIGGVIVLLLWIWIGNISLLLGAEFDAELERGRQLQGGIAAEESVQLPPRATDASEKKRDALQEDISEGRKLRLGEDGAAKDDLDRDDDGIPTRTPTEDKIVWGVLAAGLGAAALAAAVSRRKRG
jgi:membrane protein